MDDTGDPLTAFLTSLAKAVEGIPNAALVCTLAIGRDGRASDAYSEENQFIADHMAEAESVSARKATLLNPTEEDETAQVLLRRLFEEIDAASVECVVEGYRALWAANREALADEAARPKTAESFRTCFPLHPEVHDTLTGKTATLGNFQRIRGMLRLLARTIGRLWEGRPVDATAIHLHHVDPDHEPIRQEVVTRLGQGAYLPAIANDVAGIGDGKKGLAREIDAEHHGGPPPCATYVARTIFLHTLALHEPLKGVGAEDLRYSVLGPSTDSSLIEEARKRFITISAYLDDRPGAPMRFLAEANLKPGHPARGTARRRGRCSELAERPDQGDLRGTDVRVRCNSISRRTVRCSGRIGDGRPNLIVVSYDAVAAGNTVDAVPDLIERIYLRKGSEGTALRVLRNNVVFAVADELGKEEMRRKAARRLALRELRRLERLSDLAEHQQAKVLELEAKSEQELAITIQQRYRHVLYPSQERVRDSDVDLRHTAINTHSTSDKPGAGQTQIVRALRELGKLQLSEDEPYSPSYVRDRTPLKKWADDDKGAARRVPAGSGTAHPHRERHLHSRCPAWRQAGSVHLPEGRPSLRTW